MVNQQHGGNRWVSAVIPALLIHISIGTVYCWSVFKQLIADQMHVAPGIVEWGFSLAIFFLGMSAAFLGPFVEKDIKKSALISTVCFVCGFAGTGASIAAGWLPGVFIFYGVIMGIGLGVGYLTPVKNLMLWFADNKGLATGIAVAGFGLAKAIASPVMQWLVSTIGLAPMFYVLAVVYAVMMLIGFALIKRPAGYVYSEQARIRRRDIMRKPVFWAIWLAFYLNITCGLALISQEKDILHDALSILPKYASLNATQLATAIAGARKGEDDIAIGNIIGSNIFNIAIVMGLPALITPGPFNPLAFSRDYGVMLLVSVIFALLCWRRQRQIGKGAGALLTGGFIVWMAMLYWLSPLLSG